MADIKKNVKSLKDEDTSRLSGKDTGEKAFDKTGLIYGLGHAVYSIEDPRAVILRGFVEELAKEKNMEEEFTLSQWSWLRRLSASCKIYKGVSPRGLLFGSGIFHAGIAHQLSPLLPLRVL